MGIIRMIERRKESRTPADLTLTIWSVDTRGERFLQHGRARDISESGALVAGLDADLSSGDVIGILYAGKKARFRVVWIRYDGLGDKMEAAVHRIQQDPCPWLHLLQADELPAAGELGTQPSS